MECDRKIGPYPCCSVIEGDCMELMNALPGGVIDAVVLDPPFNLWKLLPPIRFPKMVCFTNFQNRESVTQMYGTPRAELIWHFQDGRWVSNFMPRLTHENILIYGMTGSAMCGDQNMLSPQMKGHAAIGKYVYSEPRWYVPAARKQLNSVQCFPRNVSKELGCWSKPQPLMDRLVEWIDATRILDPFCGSGTTLVAAKRLRRHFLGFEISATYCEIARARLDDADAQPSLFVEPPEQMTL